MKKIIIVAPEWFEKLLIERGYELNQSPNILAEKMIDEKSILISEDENYPNTWSIGCYLSGFESRTFVTIQMAADPSFMKSILDACENYVFGKP